MGVRGAFQFNENFAVELSYQNYGEIDETFIDMYGDTINDTIQTTALNIGLKGIYPLQSGVSIIGRAGLSLWDYEIEETNSFYPGEVFTLDDDGNDFYFGIGAQYDINDQFFLNVEYTLLELDVSAPGGSFDHEVENFSVSAGVNF